jgi:hypothetical protein
MPRLVHSDPASTGQRNRGDESPSRRFHAGALHAFASHLCHEGFQIAAHEIKNAAEKIMASRFLRAIVFQRMNRSFRGRCGENQPSPAGVDRFKTEHIAKKRAVGLGIRTVEKEVSTQNHAQKYIAAKTPAFDLFPTGF